MKKFIWNILRFFRLSAHIQLSYKGILDEFGWLKSFYLRQSVDKNGNPIPWCTYSFIHFIKPRLTKEMDVFEFGSGNSTIWYANRVKKVVAVEHNKKWFNEIENTLPENAKITFMKLDCNGEYSKTALNSNLKFHIIIIDGRDRNNCVYNSINSLTEDGIFIFDNSQREAYFESQKYLKEKGYKRIDFIGLCPSVAHSNKTTVFYKPTNCLFI